MFTKNKRKNLKSKSAAIEPQSPAVPKPVLKPAPAPTQPPPQITFSCQLAHGSPTAFIHGFTNVKELYQKIAKEFDVPASEILFCTLNTFKTDMQKLLGAQLGLEDFIFAHLKGRPKEVELIKSEDALGLTITDNAAGYAFIKRIKEDSVIHKMPHIQVGDHIEKLNGESTVGKRHFEIAKMLKAIPKGSTLSMRLVEPLKSGFNNISAKSGPKGSKKGIGNGKATLRFKADGNVAMEEQDDIMDVGVAKINQVLDSFLGISDADLATQIWDKGLGKANSMDFADEIDSSDLQDFGFTDDLIIELWGAITDARSQKQNLI